MTPNRDSLLRRFWRRRPKAARIVLIDEQGKRIEYVHHQGDRLDRLTWLRDGTDRGVGYIALSEIVEDFVALRSAYE